MSKRKALERPSGNAYTHKRLVFRNVRELGKHATKFGSKQAKPERHEILFSSSNFANALTEKWESLSLTNTIRGPEYVLKVIQ